MTPSIIVFDVNETLSDMSPMGQRFVEVGAPAYLATQWFTSLLRDGFALTASDRNPRFDDVGAEALRSIFSGLPLRDGTDAAVQHVMAGLNQLELHPDVAETVKALHAAGYRLATLSNGSPSVAEKLFEKAAIRDRFGALLSAEDAPLWKPASSAYQYAASTLGVSADQLLLVAAHPWDIHGASMAGLATAWLNRRDETYPKHFRAPDVTVASLSELFPTLTRDG